MFWWKRDFLGSIEDKCPKCLVKIPLTNNHLFYNHFVSLSADKGFSTHGLTRPCLF